MFHELKAGLSTRIMLPFSIDITGCIILHLILQTGRVHPPSYRVDRQAFKCFSWWLHRSAEMLNFLYENLLINNSEDVSTVLAMDETVGARFSSSSLNMETLNGGRKENGRRRWLEDWWRRCRERLKRRRECQDSERSRGRERKMEWGARH